jgi:RNA polymerase sigma factor (sigma-70 family)
MSALQAGTMCGANGPGSGPPSDVGELYQALAKRLEGIVRVGVRAPDPVIEDACQFAWSRLLHHPSRVRRETALGWLVTTAVHEAFKLLRRAAREVSLEAVAEQGADLWTAASARGPDKVYEQRERLAGLSSVSVRQQRLLWLYGLGLSYEEIARREECTARTVERQLRQARAILRTRYG